MTDGVSRLHPSTDACYLEDTGKVATNTELIFIVLQIWIQLF